MCFRKRSVEDGTKCLPRTQTREWSNEERRLERVEK
jgi:hypothetical protein